LKSVALFAASAAAFLMFAPAAANAGAALDAIKQRGTLRCGVQGPSNPGFGVPDAQGRWGGFNVEICRAIAITIFNDPAKVEFVPVTTQSRFPALAAGEVDVLSNNTTWTLTRDSNVNRFNFPAVVFYDGQAMMVPRRLNVTSARGLNGATVCVQPGTTTELNLADYFRENKMKYQAVVIESASETRNAFFSGRCDVYTNDSSSLAADRTAAPASAGGPDNFVILPERISKEPLAPVVRHGDDQFYDIVSWAVYTLFDAEEFGIDSTNVDSFANTTNPAIRRFLGIEPGMGQALGVDQRYAYNIIKAVGNYAQIFESNIGSASPIKLPRGMNALWKNGGMIYSPPAR
jgi:general L-amino acid transport system substrate-binding protein